jgi:hypothetical protein
MEDVWAGSNYRTEKNWLQEIHNRIESGEMSKIPDNEIMAFFRQHEVHDLVAPKPATLIKKYMPTFAKDGGAYQFDIWVQKNQKGTSHPQFLICINVNTKKAYAYPMQNKSAANVKRALHQFWRDAPNCKVMVSDQDSAFLAHDVIDTFLQNRIKLTTTTDENHHILGVINRLMRTLRDMRGGDHPFTAAQMAEQIKVYNGREHSTIRHAPNKMTEKLEQKFIKRQEKKAKKIESYPFKVDDMVRLLKPKPVLGKVRSNYTFESYKIIKDEGRQFVIQAEDGSTDTVPGFQLAHVPSVERYPQGKTLKDDKRAVIERIQGYNDKNQKYDIKFENDPLREHWIPVKDVREGAPTRMTLEEKKYWITRKNDKEDPKDPPPNILKMVPIID